MSRGFKGKGPEKDRSERAGESKRGKETTTHFVENAGLNRGKTLVAATPVKAKAKSRAFRESKSASAQRGEEEDMWNMPGSPEVLVLGQGEISDEADTL
jgi:hypothetical protein